MKKGIYYCPTCHMKGARSMRMQLGSVNCCANCYGFLKASQEPFFNWLLNPKDRAWRKEANPQFPNTPSNVMGKIIEIHQLKGKYSGEDVIIVCKQVRDELAQLIIKNLQTHNSHSLIFCLLQTLDELYHKSSNYTLELAMSGSLPNENITRNTLSTLKGVGITGQALERIVELSLVVGPSTSSLGCQKQDLFNLFELACQACMINYFIESYLGIWEQGVLNVSDDWLDFTPDQGEIERFERIQNRIAEDHSLGTKETFGDDSNSVPWLEIVKELHQLSKGEKPQRPSILGEAEDQFILAIDNHHRNYFGHSFSEKLLALVYLGLPSKELPNDWAFHEDVLAFLDNKLDIPAETGQTILQSLKLAGDDIGNEGAYPFELRRKFRLMRRPLPKLRVGKRFIYYLSSAFIGRGALNIKAEYLNGSYPEIQNTLIQTLAKQLDDQYAKNFVNERVVNVLRKQGYTASFHIKRIGNYNLEVIEGVGEIDIIALNSSITKLIIGDGKYRALPFIHVSQIRTELSEYMKPKKGYADKLRRKVKWIMDNKSYVLEQLFGISTNTNPECIPVFFTNMYSPACEFVDDIQFVQERDLISWAI